MAAIKIFLVDDSDVFLRGIESFLASEQDMQLVGKASCGEKALSLAKTLHSDIVLCDLRLIWQCTEARPSPEIGLRVIRDITRLLPDAGVIILSNLSERRWVVQAMDAGAQGYLPKEARPEQIISAIHTVAGGGVALTPAQLRWLRESVEPLTRREKEVLALLAEGKSDAEIAQRLGIATRTASKHVENIREKLGGGSRWEAVVEARRRGLL